MDDTQRIVKCGNLSLHSPGGFFKKRWHNKYLVLYDGSKSGIKRLELFESEIKFKKQIPTKIIALVDCVRVVTCQRQKSMYTFEVRTNDQCYLLAAQSFQDMNDWVNCLRLVAFGQSASSSSAPQSSSLVASSLALVHHNNNNNNKQRLISAASTKETFDALLDRKPQAQPQPQVTASTQVTSGASTQLVAAGGNSGITTASQAAAAAANALAKTRQRQPSLLGTCKPQPPIDSPFIQTSAGSSKNPLGNIMNAINGQDAKIMQVSKMPSSSVATALDEEEENMLYCSIEDNPSEHNYRVKVIETELALRCRLKCYQLTTPTTVNEQYEELAHLKSLNKAAINRHHHHHQELAGSSQLPPIVTFYQLIIGPQELTLLNDYAANSYGTMKQQQQGLWSWPYQCIRRYGFDKENCFMFEAGRKCTSGPGQFIVQTPKAYSIYQDVVKFVNELRSLNEATPISGGISGPVQANEKGNNDEQQQQQQASTNKTTITQIPVTWAPISINEIKSDATNKQQQQQVAPNNMQLAPETATTMDNNRQQFFDTLRQLDSTSNTNGNTAQTTKVCADDNDSTQPSDASSRDQKASLSATARLMLGQKKTNTSSNEETDESGYEQGDDSVDGSTRFKHLSGGATRKRQANSDSMSSSSSTTSGGNSPGQSVSRRHIAAVDPKASPLSNSQGPAKRHPLKQTNNIETTTPNATSKSTARPILDLHELITENVLGQQAEDFESSLIRDVYSEITKLHAKFAVASSGSAEDSMSSNSSNGSTADNLPNDDDDSCSSATSEPMYSNVRSQQQHQSRLHGHDIVDEDDLDIETDRNRPINSSRLPTNQPFHQTSYNNQLHTQLPRCQINTSAFAHNNHAPIYPTILNPIPECGEPTVQPNGLRNSRASNKDTNKKAPQRPTKGPLKPTNHYVINDVQYAKISRNAQSRFNSCL